MQAFDWGAGMGKSIGNRREQVAAKSHERGRFAGERVDPRIRERSFLELEKGSLVQYIWKAVRDGHSEHHQLIKSSKNPM